MEIDELWYQSILDGKKTIGIQNGDHLDPGEMVTMTCGELTPIEIRILEVNGYGSYKELLEKEGVANIFPGLSIEEGLKICENHDEEPTSDSDNDDGIVAFHFEVDKFASISELIGDVIEYITLHPVRLEILFKPLPPELGTWDKVLFPNTKLSITCNQTGSGDVRGGGCGYQCFPLEDFIWTVDTPGGVTLKQLVEGVYRMKGNKYDYHYELYHKIKKVSDDGIHLIILAEFGYGS